MASVSDTEDGWATLDDESSKLSVQAASDLQSKVDALQEKTDLLQLQIKLKDDSIDALTNRLDALEAADRRTRDRSEGMVTLQQQIFSVQGNLELRSKDLKSSMDDLADRVKDMKSKAERFEREINKRFEGETEHVIALESHLESIAEVDNDCLNQAVAEVHFKFDADKEDLQSQIRHIKDSIVPLKDRVDGLATNVERVAEDSFQRLKWEINSLTDMKSRFERLKKEINDRLDREANGAGAFRNDTKRLVQENKECVDNLEKEVGKDILSVQRALIRLDHERNKREADLRDELKADAERVECENETRMEDLEHQNQALQDGLSHTKSLIGTLRNSINDALTQTYTEFSDLKQRVETLEGSGLNSDSACTIATSTAESQLRNLEAWKDGLQSNGYANQNSYYRAVNPYFINYGYLVPPNVGSVQR